MKKRVSILLIMCVFIIIGSVLIPRLEYSDKPRKKQGKTLVITYQWPGSSPKLMEQQVTSRIEGLISTVKGIEHIYSDSRSGDGIITIILKEDSPVDAIKFEIASLLRNIEGKLPDNCSNPILTGGEQVAAQNETALILSYQVYAPEKTEVQIRHYIEDVIKSRILKQPGVYKVDIQGGTDKYLQIIYDAEKLSLYNITSADIEDAIRCFLGRNDVIGEVLAGEGGQNVQQRMSLTLCVPHDSIDIAHIPVKNIDGSIIYLNDLASLSIKTRQPNSYFRINGMSTIYLNIYAHNRYGFRKTANNVKKNIHEKEGCFFFNKTYDAPEEQLQEISTQINYFILSVAILIALLWIISRRWRYVLIVTISLASTVLTCVIFYYLADVTINPVSLAGITMSLGLIIDSTIIMADHYINYHNRFCLYAIITATLTTTSALFIIFFIPRELQANLYEFAWVVVINLIFSIVGAAFFVPSLIEYMGYVPSKNRHRRNTYRYIKYRGIFLKYVDMLSNVWIKRSVIGIFVLFFVMSIYIYAHNTENIPPNSDKEKHLVIYGKMPTGGSTSELNTKVVMIEALLSKYKEIKRFTTMIDSHGATITVDFMPQYVNGMFPYQLEKSVISKILSIGGADWATYGVSERGFSNSIMMQYRSHHISLNGYNYDKLYYFANKLCDQLKLNQRVRDIIIQHEQDEVRTPQIYINYKKDKLALYDISPQNIYSALKGMTTSTEVGKYIPNGSEEISITLEPLNKHKFDIWHLENSCISVNGRPLLLSDIMDLTQRDMPETIPRKDQQYFLTVAFNVLGPYSYAHKIITRAIDELNASLPVGFKVEQPSPTWANTRETQYWSIGVVIAIIFFICVIAFESLYKALSIIMLIPVSLIGTFLTYYLMAIPFESGAFAAILLVCGLTVNAGIYIFSETDRIRKRISKTTSGIVVAVIWRKIRPILLTTITTVAGLSPFLFNSDIHNFWYVFAIGASAGLIFSLFPIFFMLPALLITGKKNLYRSC